MKFYSQTSPLYPHATSPIRWVMLIPPNVLEACDITAAPVPDGQLPAWHHHLNGH